VAPLVPLEKPLVEHQVVVELSVGFRLGPVLLEAQEIPPEFEMLTTALSQSRAALHQQRAHTQEKLLTKTRLKPLQEEPHWI